MIHIDSWFVLVYALVALLFWPLFKEWYAKYSKFITRRYKRLLQRRE